MSAAGREKRRFRREPGASREIRTVRRSASSEDRETRPLVLNLFKNVVGIVLLAFTLLVLRGFGPLLEIAPRDLLLLGLSAFVGLYMGDTLLFASLRRIGASLPFLLSCFYAPSAVLMAWMIPPSKHAVKPGGSIETNFHLTAC